MERRLLLELERPGLVTDVTNDMKSGLKRLKSLHQYSCSARRYLPHMGTEQASFWTVGSVVKHQGPSGLLLGLRQKFSWRMLFGSEALYSLEVSRQEKLVNMTRPL